METPHDAPLFSPAALEEGLAHLGVGSLGLVLAASLALLLLVLWRRQPVTSYRMVVWILVGTLALPLAQLLVQRTSLLESTPLARSLAARLPEWARPAAQGATGGHEHGAGGEVRRVLTYQLLLTADPEVEPATAGAAQDVVSELGPTATVEGELAPLYHGRAMLEPFVELREAPTAAASSASTFPWPAALLGLYTLGVLVSLARTGLRVRATRRLLAHAEPVTDAATLEVWREVLEGSPLAGRARLEASHDVHVPMCFGLRRPTVILPASGEPRLAPQVLACVLLHELVHLERRDTWVMLGQEVARALFWFHPAAWWLCRRIDSLRELSCDHLVVDRTGRRRRYASALVEYAEWMRGGLRPSPATPAAALLPWTTSKSQLTRRIEMLVALSGQRSHAARRPLMFAAGTLFLALWGGQLAVAAAMSSGQTAPDDDRCEACRKKEAKRVKAIELKGLGDDDEVTVLEVPTAGELEAKLKGKLGKVGGSGRVLLETLGGDGEGPTALFIDEDGEVQTLGGSGYTWSTEEGEGGARYVVRGLGQGNVLGDGGERPRMIGVRISESSDDEGRIVIEEVIDGSLAEVSGLRAQDVIVEIDGEDASLGTLRKAKRKLGKEKVKLSVERADEGLVVVELEDADGGPHVVELKGLGEGKGVLELKGIGEGPRFIDLDALEGLDKAHRLKTLGKLRLGEADSKVRAKLRVLGGDDDSGHVYALSPEGKLKLETYSLGDHGFYVLGDDDGDAGELEDAKKLYAKALKSLPDASGDAKRALGRAKLLLEREDGEGPIYVELEDTGDAAGKAYTYYLKKRGEQADGSTNDRIEELRRELEKRAAELEALRRELDSLRKSRGVSQRATRSTPGLPATGVGVSLSPVLGLAR